MEVGVSSGVAPGEMGLVNVLQGGIAAGSERSGQIGVLLSGSREMFGYEEEGPAYSHGLLLAIDCDSDDFELIELIEVTHVVGMELEKGGRLCKRYRTLARP